MDIDLPTIMLAVLLANAASAIGLTIMLPYLAQEPALKFWFAMKVLALVGLSSLFFRPHLPTEASILVTNLALMVTYAMAWTGARVFNRRKPLMWLVVGLPLVAMLPIGWYTFIDPSPGQRLLFSAIVYCFFIVLGTFEHLRGGRGAAGLRLSRQLVPGGAFAVLALTWLWTILSVSLDLQVMAYLGILISPMIFLISFITDVTYSVGIIAIIYERLHKKAMATTKRLESLLEEQRQFSLMLSHEFRNPLAAIDRSADFLLQTVTGLRPEQCERLTNIRQRSAVLDGLVGTFLSDEAARTAYGDAQHDPMDLPELWRQVEEMVALEHGPIALARLRVTVPSGPVPGPGAFLGHGPSLVRAVGTLIDNACKYSPDDAPVSVTLSATNDHVTVEVSDCGIGIPAADLTQIPRRFFRGQNVLRQPGSGLGLSTVAWVAERHGGRLELDSVEGEGTRVRLVLPRILSDTPAQEAAGIPKTSAVSENT